MDWIEANGVSLRYEISGQGTTPLVLVHELGGALESWDEVLPALQKQFKVLRYDQRGAGLSEKNTVLTLDSPAVLVGTALGSDFAIAFTAREPQRVLRLVATSPAEGLTPDRFDGLKQRAKTVLESGMRAVVEQSLNVSYQPALRGNAERFERYRARWLANAPPSFAALNLMLAGMSMKGRFEQVECETLIISGTQDTLRTPDAVEAIAKQFKHGTYRQVDTGHFMAVQTPELFLSETLPFMRGDS
jgi:3-oxoadipate enol-lactonase